MAHRVRDPIDKKIYITHDISNLVMGGIDFNDDDILDSII